MMDTSPGVLKMCLKPVIILLRKKTLPSTCECIEYVPYYSNVYSDNNITYFNTYKYEE